MFEIKKLLRNHIKDVHLSTNLDVEMVKFRVSPSAGTSNDGDFRPRLGGAQLRTRSLVLSPCLHFRLCHCFPVRLAMSTGGSTFLTERDTLFPARARLF